MTTRLAPVLLAPVLLAPVLLAPALLASVLLAPSAFAATTEELGKPIHQFIDGFNKGDTRSAYAAYAHGPISIIDEFAPHAWLGPKAPQHWAADYDKHAKATGVTDGAVTLGDITRTEVDGKDAYVVVSTVYNYKEGGKPVVEEGQMTYALKATKHGWKIRAWTWSGVKPHAPK